MTVKEMAAAIQELREAFRGGQISPIEVVEYMTAARRIAERGGYLKEIENLLQF